MNSNIIKKCIDKLKEDKPDIQYVLGMLETLYEMQPAMPTAGAMVGGSSVVKKEPDLRKIFPTEARTEGNVLDAEAAARLKNIPPEALND